MPPIDNRGDSFLLNDLSLKAPAGFFAQLGLCLGKAYFDADYNTKSDPDVGKADFKSQRGQRRFAYCNSGFRNLAERFKDRAVTYQDVCMGVREDGSPKDDGSNNHTRVFFADYLLTQHHVAEKSQLPKSAVYVKECSQLNERLSQGEFFKLSEIVSEPATLISPLLHAMVVHTEGDDGMYEIGSIELVFVQNGRRVASVELEELVQLQTRIQSMDEIELVKFKTSHEEFRRKRA